MKIVLTGSLGNIGKPLTKKLVEKGHTIIVISSKAERQNEIEAMGAQAAIGSIEDVAFLTKTFTGADLVYCMVTHDKNAFFDQNIDLIASITQIGINYKQAIATAAVKKVIYLSSIGAHTDKNNGILLFHFNVENTLKELANDVSIKFMRPTGFFTNLYRYIASIKSNGNLVSNYGGDKKEPWVSPLDIASVIAEEIELPFIGRTVRYIASEEISPNKIAETLGEAIGNTNLKWLQIPDEQLLNEMIAIGMNPNIAKGFVEMQASQGNGFLYEDYYLNLPVMGEIKCKDFAKDFEEIYNQK